MDATRFEQGLTYQEFVNTMRQNDRRIKQMYENYKLTEDDIARFKTLADEHGGKLYITALVEDWCPDVVLNVPLVAHLAEAIDGIELRLFDRRDNNDLQEAFAAQNILSIPVISFFNSDWEEVARFVERSAIARSKVIVWTAENYPELDDLRRSSKPEDREKLVAIFTKRFSQMVKWYRQGLWRESLKEFEAQLAGGK
ncbi:MAG: thioredoxin family protein [Chloroflexi bacterium]|nr:thioredoxin family protein [Chloroflexota bacterium]